VVLFSWAPVLLSFYVLSSLIVKSFAPFQDRTLERQFFELIINLASLQPIAEDRPETEDRRLRQSPTMIVALPLPLFTPDFSDAP